MFDKSTKRGRKKGSVNKVGKQLKEMILAALDESGGKDYLVRQAGSNPTAFMTLLGKVLPLTLAGDAANPIHVINDTDKAIIDRFTNQLRGIAP